MNILRNNTMDILFDISRKLKEAKIEHLALGCGSCNICEECTYPLAPCRFPEKVFPPIEAFGIDVFSLCEITGMKYTIEDNNVIFFCMIYFNETY